MAASGMFTYRDLYGGRPENYHHSITPQTSTSSTTRLPPISNTTIASFIITTDPVQLISTTTTTATTTQSDSEFYTVVQTIPFAYFHWFLIGLAFLLALFLTIIFTYFCRGHCRKHNKSRKEKKQPLPNFYRYRTTKRHVQAQDVYEPTTPFTFPSPTRPCPSKSTERRNSHLLRQGLDAVGSPPIPRRAVSQLELPSSFSSTASDLLTEIKSRFSIHSSKSSLNKDRSYEIQRAKMSLHDESKNDSLSININ